MCGKQIREQLPPLRVLAVEGDVDAFAAGSGRDVRDVSIPVDPDGAWEGRHVSPHVAEVLDADGDAIRPLRGGVDLVPQRERPIRDLGDLGDQITVALHPPVGGAFVGAGQSQRGEQLGIGAEVRTQVRVESLVETIDHDRERIRGQRHARWPLGSDNPRGWRIRDTCREQDRKDGHRAHAQRPSRPVPRHVRSLLA